MANRCSYSAFHVVQHYRYWQNVSLIFHKAPQEECRGGIRFEYQRDGEMDPSQLTHRWRYGLLKRAELSDFRKLRGFPQNSEIFFESRQMLG